MRRKNIKGKESRLESNLFYSDKFQINLNAFQTRKDGEIKGADRILKPWKELCKLLLGF